MVLLLTTSQFSSAAKIEWNGATGADFFDESNWLITEGTIGNNRPGTPPPQGTIDPFTANGGAEPIMHDLLLLNGLADYSAGDIGLAASTGTLSLFGDATLDTMSMSSIFSFGDFGASISTAENATLNSRFLSGIDLSMADNSTVFLTDENDPLPEGTQTILLTTMPSPCLVFDSVDPKTAETMYMESIESATGMVEFRGGNPFGTVIKSANLPEPSSVSSALLAVFCLGFLRRKKTN